MLLNSTSSERLAPMSNCNPTYNTTILTDPTLAHLAKRAFWAISEAEKSLVCQGGVKTKNIVWWATGDDDCYADEVYFHNGDWSDRAYLHDFTSLKEVM